MNNNAIKKRAKINRGEKIVKLQIFDVLFNAFMQGGGSYRFDPATSIQQHKYAVF